MPVVREHVPFLSFVGTPVADAGKEMMIGVAQGDRPSTEAQVIYKRVQRRGKTSALAVAGHISNLLFRREFRRRSRLILVKSGEPGVAR